MRTSELVGLRLREAHALEQASFAKDTQVRNAHLNIADILHAQIAHITASQQTAPV